MELTNPQSDIFNSSARFRTVVAGRRFGKTFLSTIEIIRAATAGKNKNCWYIAPTYGAAKEIAWDMMIHTIPDEYIAKTNETALTLRLINGSTIALKGAEKPNNLRGRALDFVVLDEFADMRPETWTEVIRASLSDRQGNALFIGTPKGRNHFYELWADGLGSKDNWASFQYTTIEGGNVPPDEIEQAQNDLDERTFNQEYCAEFVTYSGLIYYAFSRELSVIDIEDNHSTLLIGMDFNLDPMSAVICIRHGVNLLAIDEIVMYGSNTDEMAAEIKARYPDRTTIIFPDRIKTAQNKCWWSHRLSILQNAGFSVKVKKQHPLVRDRINAVNSRLLTSDGQRHLFFSPKCRQTIKSLERQTYKEGTSQPNKDGFDHMNDALGYLVEYLFPVRKEYNVQQPARWT